MRRWPSRKFFGTRGFSLIELMVTIAIAGILTSLAAPSMTRIIQSNRVQTEAAGLLSDLQYARTEAVKRGQPVSVCASSDQQTCLGANSWQSGWIVFFDKSGNGVVDATDGDTVLRRRAAFNGADTAVANPAANYVVFNREGFANLGTSVATFTFHTPDNSTKATRCIAVNIGGRLTTQIAGQAACN